MNAAIAQAVAIFRKFPHASDDEILRELVATGIDRTLASRLVEFLPMAYCRLILKDTGVRFSDYFQRRLGDGKLSGEQPLSSEHLWAEILSFAGLEKQNGIAGTHLLVIAARSSEFDAAHPLAKQGSKLNDITLTTTVFCWPEEGPVLSEFYEKGCQGKSSP